MQESQATKEFTPPPRPFDVFQLLSSEPFDPGPLQSSQSIFPTLMKILPRYQNNLSSEARINFSNFLLVFRPCHTAISVIGDDVVFGYGTRKSFECPNIRTLFTAHYLFDEMVLTRTCYFLVKNELLHFKTSPYMNYFLQFGANCVRTIVGSSFTVPLDTLLKKHVIIRLVSLTVIITIGYEFNCVTGRIYFVIAATHGSNVHVSKLFESLTDIMIRSSLIKSCAMFCSTNLASYLLAVMILLSLELGNCTLFVFCSPNIHCDNHRVCLDVESMRTASISHANGSLQIPTPLVEKLQATFNTHVLLHNSILSSIITNYLGLDYIVANPPPPPEPPDGVVIRTSLLVQHVHEQAWLSSLLLLTVTGNLNAAPPPPEPPDLCHKVVNMNAICHNWRFVVCSEVGFLRFYHLIIASVALISFPFQLNRKEFEAFIFEVCAGSIIIFPSDMVINAGDLGVVDFDVNDLINLVKRWVETTSMCYQLSFYYGNFCRYKGYILWTEHAKLKMHGHKVFNESYENYGSMNKAYKLLHDMKKRDMAFYSLMSQGSGMHGNTIGSTGLVAQIASKECDFNYTTYTGFCIGEPLDIATSLIHVSKRTYYVVLVQYLSAYPSHGVIVTDVVITRVIAYKARHAKLRLVRV
jgi:hypothetical protein